MSPCCRNDFRERKELGRLTIADTRRVLVVEKILTVCRESMTMEGWAVEGTSAIRKEGLTWVKRAPLLAGIEVTVAARDRTKE